MEKGIAIIIGQNFVIIGVLGAILGVLAGK